jgi:adenylate cyclase class IV
MYEVELKAELTKEEKKKLEQAFKERGFEFRKQTPQKDYYVEAKKSPYYDQGGKYDLRRYRDEDEELIYTAKIWEMIDGHLARQEEEYEVSREKFDEEIKKYPEAIKIEKVRDWYWVEYKGQKISLTMDTVDFDHSPETRWLGDWELVARLYMYVYVCVCVYACVCMYTYGIVIIWRENFITIARNLERNNIFITQKA